MIPNV
jgi:hypothetical protein